ncbi:hypothetical protein BCV70DRAFT_184434 [Testicularia cyperi]|uniref:Stress-response A/B barrel domain-containing protein n=1 Tax=Testicularia cyperi TaxID=1882483 RepID=A0A317XZ96_9BASI|nr:hypothetical protein BCV70DRAFT_184434 [Testicularia cyperi]
MVVIHVVAFKFKESVGQEMRQEIYDEFNQFKSNCKQADGSQYIVDFKSGDVNTSKEGGGKGFHQTFVVTFASQDHVTYYVNQDPVHVAFVKKVFPLLEDVFIYDFDA